MGLRSVRCLIVLGAALPGAASAASWSVDPTGSGDFETLEEAVAAASDGDTIQLSPGDHAPARVEDRQLSISGTIGATRIGAMDIRGGRMDLSGLSFVGTGTALNLQGGELTGTGLVFEGGGHGRLDPALVASGSALVRLSAIRIEDWRSTGGVMVVGDGANVTVSGSAFEGNGAPNGGAIRVDGGSVTVDSSTFSDNDAAAWGGDIAAIDGHVTVHGCEFYRSQATNGGGIAAGGTAIVQVEDSTFSATEASVAGGFLYVEGTSATMARVSGVDASAPSGGAVALFRAHLDGEDLTLARNRATSGGQVHGSESDASLVRTTFTAGVAETGAAVTWAGGNLDVSNAIWASQEGAAAGGAIYVENGVVDIEHAVLADNRADLGSAIAIVGGQVNLDSSIVYRNHGDAIVGAGGGFVHFGTSVIYGTDGDDYTGQVVADNSVKIIDPRFSAAPWGDYTLRATSPALDALSGSADPDGSAPDIGAFGGPNAWVLPDGDEDGYVYGRDCDDTDPNVFETADDVWYDGLDTDCQEDNDYDQDRDGYAAAEFGGLDCDDTDAARSPGAEEDSGDRLDADCDGLFDRDADGDGWTDGLDCDDDDPDVHPMATDPWYDGVDSDCQGNDDFDADRDGISTLDGDCDDTDDRVSPDAAEVADDGVDQDCDGADLSLPDDDSIDSDSETAVAGSDADTPESLRVPTTTGCSTTPGDGQVPASILALCGLLLFSSRRRT